MEKGRSIDRSPLTVLILEDVSEDAELMIDQLEEQGFKVRSHIVDDLVSYREALENFKPDVILSDYRMPKITGLEALEIASNVLPQVPFIFVTGAVGEEIAAETILSGASGLVLKNHLQKLPAVVEKALAKNRWYNPRLKEANSRLQQRIQENIKVMSRVREFLSRTNSSEQVSSELDDALADLKRMGSEMNSEENHVH